MRWRWSSCWFIRSVVRVRYGFVLGLWFSGWLLWLGYGVARILGAWFRSLDGGSIIWTLRCLTIKILSWLRLLPWPSSLDLQNSKLIRSIGNSMWYLILLRLSLFSSCLPKNPSINMLALSLYMECGRRISHLPTHWLPFLMSIEIC